MQKIPLSQPEVLDEDIQAVNKVLRSGQLAFGEVLSAFEDSFAAYCEVDHAIAVSSGTAALHLSLMLAGVGEGDEVIVSPFSFIASSNVAFYQRAKPVFVDIEEDTLGLDPSLLQAALTPHTKAVLPTHVFGHPCQIRSIDAFCKANGLVLVEDNCESLGAKVNTDGSSHFTGQFGDYVAYGFYPNKLMTTGEGGILTVKDAEKAILAKSLRNQGRSTMGGIHLVHEMLGYNYRMSDIQAALGATQLSRLSATIQRRCEIAAKYTHHFSSVAGVRTPSTSPGYEPAWFVYYIRVDKEIRDFLVSFLAEAGVQTRPYFYPPIHLQPFYKERLGTKEGDFPVAEKVSKEIIALPFFNQLSDEQIEQVVDTVKKGISAA